MTEGIYDILAAGVWNGKEAVKLGLTADVRGCRAKQQVLSTRFKSIFSSLFSASDSFLDRGVA